MLPAITAELPAYLVPPKARSENQSKRVEPGFGPDTKVDIRREGAQAAAQGGTTAGVYGPDGQFVEAASRRTVRQEAPEPRDTSPPRDADPPRDTSPPREAPSRSENNRETRAATETDRPPRDLALNEFDVAVPPAELEELRELANRVDRLSRTRTPKEYERIGKLMDRVGRYDAAQRARIAAEADQPTEQADESAALLQASQENEAARQPN